MTTRAATRPKASIAGRAMPDPAALIDAIADTLLVVGQDGEIRYANLAAEQFFKTSAANLRGQRLDALLPNDSPLFSLIAQVLAEGSTVAEHGVTLDAPRIGSHFVNLQVAPMPDAPDCVVVTVHQQSIARQIDHQLSHRNAARSVAGMAALLAHEVKNPLSGIRGAAQLLERNLTSEDLALTQLICDETDRICALVDRMEVFSDRRPVERSAVNIHEVLDHVVRIAQSGFARNVRFTESYDPSLPPVDGNRDQLVQVFLNLVKNAAEAAPPSDGEITLASAYQSGVHLAVPGGNSRVQLPLVISVGDNGDGVPDDLRDNLFDPFVTAKPAGTGLGLALVAKIVGDHGGVIEFDSQPRRTVFRVLLPVGGGDREGP